VVRRVALSGLKHRRSGGTGDRQVEHRSERRYDGTRGGRERGREGEHDQRDRGELRGGRRRAGEGQQHEIAGE